MADIVVSWAMFQPRKASAPRDIGAALGMEIDDNSIASIFQITVSICIMRN
jgi:hypothetical protein